MRADAKKYGSDQLGKEQAFREYYKVLEARLANLIRLVQGKLNKRDRTA